MDIRFADMSDPRENERDSQHRYAELDPNTAPQICYGSAPEVFAPIQPDVSYEHQDGAPAQTSEGIKDPSPKGTCARLGKLKVMWLAGVTLTICIILAIGISVPLAGDTISRSSKAGGSKVSPSKSDSPTKVDGISPIVPTVSAYLPIQPLSGASVKKTTQTTEVPGCERNKYNPNVDWVGIRGGNDWDFQLKTLGSAVGCCGYCFGKAKECNAWLYAPAKGPGLDCTLILGYEGDDADDECPNRRPDVIFNVEDNKSRNMAGSGPCSGSAKNE